MALEDDSFRSCKNTTTDLCMEWDMTALAMRSELNQTYAQVRYSETITPRSLNQQMFYDIPQSNSNRLIFSFPFTHLIGESPITILAYWEDVLQQIDFFLSPSIHEWTGSSHACGSCGQERMDRKGEGKEGGIPL